MTRPRLTATRLVAAADKPLSPIMLTGGELDGARLDAALSFPGMIKQNLTDWHVGFPPETINGKSRKSFRAPRPADSREALF